MRPQMFLTAAFTVALVACNSDRGKSDAKSIDSLRQQTTFCTVTPAGADLLFVKEHAPFRLRGGDTVQVDAILQNLDRSDSILLPDSLQAPSEVAVVKVSESQLERLPQQNFFPGGFQSPSDSGVSSFDPMRDPSSVKTKLLEGFVDAKLVTNCLPMRPMIFSGSFAEGSFLSADGSVSAWFCALSRDPGGCENKAESVGTVSGGGFGLHGREK